MRKFRTINKRVTKDLLSKFPNLREVILVDDEISNIYQRAHISVFDHWLSRSEANNEITNIPNQIFNLMLHDFTFKLFICYQGYFVKLKGNRTKSISLKVSTSVDALRKIIEPAHHLISDHYRFVAIIPELELIYFEGCDYTHHILYKSESKFSEAAQLIKDCNLYVLK